MSVVEPDSKPWFYSTGHRPSGPVTWDHLLDLSRSGVIQRETKVWQLGSLEQQCFEDALEIVQSAAASARNQPQVEKSQEKPVEPFTFRSVVQPSVQDTEHEWTTIDTVTMVDGWTNKPVRPWRRYGARMLDTVIHGSIGIFAFVSVFSLVAPLAAYEMFGKETSPFWLRLSQYMLTSFLAVPIGALLLGLSGTTIGKLIFGVKVGTPDGRPIGIARALRRELYVWARGLGFGFPLLTLFCLIAAKRELERRLVTAWDRNGPLQVTHRPSGGTQTALNILGIGLIVVGRLLS